MRIYKVKYEDGELKTRKMVGKGHFVNGGTKICTKCVLTTGDLIEVGGKIAIVTGYKEVGKEKQYSLRDIP